MAWKISTAKRRALVKLQLRDKKGRWIEMGRGVKWYSSKKKRQLSGIVEGSKGMDALVRLDEDGSLVRVKARSIEVIDNKADLDGPAPKGGTPADKTPEFESPEAVAKVDPENNGSGSAAPSADPASNYNVSDTSDGNTYISRADGASIYTPASELKAGDEVLSPDGADPSKPFSMGRNWATKKAERLNNDGPRTGKVISVNDRYAVVQLPEGQTVADRNGNETDLVTVGRSSNVIKATPGMKEALGERINSANFVDPEADEQEIDENLPENASDHEGREVTSDLPDDADLETDVRQEENDLAERLSAAHESAPTLYNVKLPKGSKSLEELQINVENLEATDLPGYRATNNGIEVYDAPTAIASIETGPISVLEDQIGSGEYEFDRAGGASARGRLKGLQSVVRKLKEAYEADPREYKGDEADHLFGSRRRSGVSAPESTSAVPEGVQEGLDFGDGESSSPETGADETTEPEAGLTTPEPTGVPEGEQEALPIRTPKAKATPVKEVRADLDGAPEGTRIHFSDGQGDPTESYEKYLDADGKSVWAKLDSPDELIESNEQYLTSEDGEDRAILSSTDISRIHKGRKYDKVVPNALSERFQKDARDEANRRRLEEPVKHDLPLVKGDNTAGRDPEAEAPSEEEDLGDDFQTDEEIWMDMQERNRNSRGKYNWDREQENAYLDAIEAAEAEAGPEAYKNSPKWAETVKRHFDAAADAKANPPEEDPKSIEDMWDHVDDRNVREPYEANANYDFAVRNLTEEQVKDLPINTVYVDDNADSPGAGVGYTKVGDDQWVSFEGYGRNLVRGVHRDADFVGDDEGTLTFPGHPNGTDFDEAELSNIREQIARRDAETAPADSGTSDAPSSTAQASPEAAAILQWRIEQHTNDDFGVEVGDDGTVTVTNPEAAEELFNMASGDTRTVTNRPEDGNTSPGGQEIRDELKQLREQLGVPDTFEARRQAMLDQMRSDRRGDSPAQSQDSSSEPTETATESETDAPASDSNSGPATETARETSTPTQEQVDELLRMADEAEESYGPAAADALRQQAEDMLDQVIASEEGEEEESSEPETEAVPEEAPETESPATESAPEPAPVEEVAPAQDAAPVAETAVEETSSPADYNSEGLTEDESAEVERLRKLADRAEKMMDDPRTSPERADAHRDALERYTASIYDIEQRGQERLNNMPQVEETPEASVPAPEESPEVVDATETVDPGEAAPQPAPVDSANPLDGLGVERRTPEAVEGEQYAPTQQQQDVIDAVLGGLDTVVQAKAGSGKTSTLKAISRRIALKDPDARIGYIAFNKSVQLEAEATMPKNTEPRTGHSLAHRWAPSWMNKRKSEGLTRSDDIAEHLGITEPLVINRETGEAMSPSEQAMVARKTVDAYANSADDFIDIQHLPHGYRGDEEVERTLLTLANSVWSDWSDRNGKIKMTFDGERKHWALSRPDFSKEGSGLGTPISVLFIDEAQDTPPVLAKVVADQSIQKVVVGDADQAIYGFTGATDYLSKAGGDVELPLNKSWRFGPQVADMGNRFLQLVGSDQRVIGGGPDSEIVDGMEDADAILVRTNAGMIGSIMEELERGRKVGVPSGTKGELLNMVHSVQFLQGEANAPSKMNDDLAPFRTWEEFLKEEDKGLDQNLTKIKNLVEAYGTESLKRTISEITDENLFEKVTWTSEDGKLIATYNAFDVKESLKAVGFRWKKHPTRKKRDGSPASFWTFEGTEAEQTAAFEKAREQALKDSGVDVVVSTAHKSKGLEWGRVRIGDDFFEPRLDKDTGKMIMPSQEEMKLNYVAVTRAEKALDLGSLKWVTGYTDENGGQTGNAGSPEEDEVDVRSPESEVTAPVVAEDPEGVEDPQDTVSETGFTPVEEEYSVHLEELLDEAYSPTGTGDVEEIEKEIDSLERVAEERRDGAEAPEFTKNPALTDPESIPEVEDEPVTYPERVPAGRRTRMNYSGVPVLDANGKAVAAGDMITHPRFGPVQVEGVVANSQRVKFTAPDGTSKSVAANKVWRIDPSAPVEAEAPETFVSMAELREPGSVFLDPATGIKAFADMNGNMVKIGDRITDPRTGRSGTVKARYTRMNGLAQPKVEWDDGSTQRVNGELFVKEGSEGPDGGGDSSGPDAGPDNGGDGGDDTPPEQPDAPEADPAVDEVVVDSQTPSGESGVSPNLPAIQSAPRGTVSSQGGQNYIKTGDDDWHHAVGGPFKMGETVSSKRLAEALDNAGITDWYPQFPAGYDPDSVPTDRNNLYSDINVSTYEATKEHLSLLENGSKIEGNGNVFIKKTDRSWISGEGIRVSEGQLLGEVSEGGYTASQTPPIPETVSGTSIAPPSTGNRMVDRKLLQTYLSNAPTGTFVDLVGYPEGQHYQKIAEDTWKGVSGIIKSSEDLRVSAIHLPGEITVEDLRKVAEGPLDRRARRTLRSATPGHRVIAADGRSYTKVDEDLWRNEQYGTEWSGDAFGDIVLTDPGSFSISTGDGVLPLKDTIPATRYATPERIVEGRDFGLQSLKDGKSVGDLIRDLELSTIVGTPAFDALKNGVDEWFKDLSSKLPEGYTVQNNSPIESARFNQFGTQGQIYKGDQRVGGFIRTFFKEGDKAVVNHEVFSLTEDHQGAGIARTLTTESYNLYQQLGMDEVHMEANLDVGGYAWAREGYDFVSLSAGQDLFDAIDMRVNGQEDREDSLFVPEPGNELQYEASVREFQRLKSLATPENWDNGTFPTPFEISQIGRDQAIGQGAGARWFGKDLLLHSKWYAMKEIPKSAPREEVTPSNTEVGVDANGVPNNVEPLKPSPKVESIMLDSPLGTRIYHPSGEYWEKTGPDSWLGNWEDPREQETSMIADMVNDEWDEYRIGFPDGRKLDSFGLESETNLINEFLEARSILSRAEVGDKVTHPDGREYTQTEENVWKNHKYGTVYSRDQLANLIDATEEGYKLVSGDGTIPDITPENAPDSPSKSSTRRLGAGDIGDFGLNDLDGGMPFSDWLSGETGWDMHSELSEKISNSFDKFAEHLTEKLPGNLKATANVNMYDAENGQIEVDFQFYDGETYIGRAERVIKRTYGEFDPETGEPIPDYNMVYHKYFKLNEGYRGNGVSEVLMEESMNLWKKLGVGKVTLNANIDVGGYAWARYGFNFKNVGSMNRFFNEANYRLLSASSNYPVKPKNISGEDWERGMAEFRKLMARATAHNFKNGTAPTPFEISQIGRKLTQAGGRDSMWFGKLIMLDSNWDGEYTIG